MDGLGAQSGSRLGQGPGRSLEGVLCQSGLGFRGLGVLGVLGV